MDELDIIDEMDQIWEEFPKDQLYRRLRVDKSRKIPVKGTAVGWVALIDGMRVNYELVEWAGGKVEEEVYAVEDAQIVPAIDRLIACSYRTKDSLFLDCEQVQGAIAFHGDSIEARAILAEDIMCKAKANPEAFRKRIKGKEGADAGRWRTRVSIVSGGLPTLGKRR